MTEGIRQAQAVYDTFTRLVRVQTDLWNRVDGQLRIAHGAPLGNIAALQIIGSAGDCRVQDLVDQLHITVGGASKLADRLVAAGHASRVSNPNDRRSSILIVTPAGVELLALAQPTIDTILAKQFGGILSPAEVLTLNELLLKVQARPIEDER